MRRTKALFFTPWFPADRSSGGAQRAGHLLDALRRRADVDVVVYDTPAPPTGRLDELRRAEGILAFAATAGPPGAPPEQQSLLKRVRARLDPLHDFRPRWTAAAWRDHGVSLTVYDLIVCRYLKNAAHLGLVGADNLALDVDDDERTVLASALAAPLRSGDAPQVLRRRLRRLERALPAFMAAIPEVLVADVNEASRYRGSRVTWLPNFPRRPERLAPPVPEPRFFTVGTGGWQPFVDGVDWYLRDVWPRVRARLPQATLAIAARGAAPETACRWSSHDGVVWLGEVEDVTPHYAAAAVSLACNWYGGGSSIKLLEALAHGRPVVATGFSRAPYSRHLDERVGLFHGADGAAIADSCVRVGGDHALRASLLGAAVPALDAHFSAAAFDAAVGQLFEGRALGRVGPP